MSSDDWNYCIEVLAFMKPFYNLVQRLEGKAESGNRGFAWEILPAYDFMKAHLAESILQSNSNEWLDVDDSSRERAMFQTNLLNAQAKLNIYREFLDSPIYILAVVLVPWYKWEYFEQKWTRSKVKSAQESAFQYFETHYSSMPGSLDGSEASAAIAQASKEPDLLDDFMAVRPRAVARSNSLKEEWDRYCNAELVDKYPIEIDPVTEKPKKEQRGPLYWWGEYARLYPRLAQMARDLLSIPGMSAEVERLFSSAKLMLVDTRASLQEDIIEAGECVRSWVKGGLV